MKCINEACGSTDVDIINAASSSMFKKVYQSFGVVCCMIGTTIPQIKGPAIKTGHYLEEEIKNHSTLIQYRCKKCGCVWTKRKVF